MTPASRAPGVSSEGKICAATASSSLASSGVRISNGAPRARARRAWAAAVWMAGRCSASQAPPTSAPELATKSRRDERWLTLLGGRPAVRRAARVRQVHDLPSVGPPHQIEHIYAAVTELVAAVERVLGPHGGQAAVHPDLGVPDAFVPDLVARSPARMPSNTRRMTASTSGSGVWDATGAGAVARRPLAISQGRAFMG